MHKIYKFFILFFIFYNIISINFNKNKLIKLISFSLIYKIYIDYKIYKEIKDLFIINNEIQKENDIKNYKINYINNFSIFYSTINKLIEQKNTFLQKNYNDLKFDELNKELRECKNDNEKILILNNKIDNIEKILNTFNNVKNVKYILFKKKEPEFIINLKKKLNCFEYKKYFLVNIDFDIYNDNFKNLKFISVNDISNYCVKYKKLIDLDENYIFFIKKNILNNNKVFIDFFLPLLNNKYTNIEINDKNACKILKLFKRNIQELDVINIQDFNLNILNYLADGNADGNYEDQILSMDQLKYMLPWINESLNDKYKNIKIINDENACPLLKLTKKYFNSKSINVIFNDNIKNYLKKIKE